ncbi:MAG: CotH kinase family protein [Duncaniella sp.]|nr:CotH kinase family protein [Duncaniella sp.]
MRLLTSLLTFAAAASMPVASEAELIINELMQSNIDCIMDDLNEFPDSWVELYNAGTSGVSLSSYSIGIKPDGSDAYQLPSQTVRPGGYVIVYCDKVGDGMHTPFRLDSGKGAAVYLYKGSTLVDKVEGLKKQPAPNISYGRVVDKASVWVYQCTSTPGHSNCGRGSNEILGKPVFSHTGRVGALGFSLSLSLPSDAPDGTEIRYTTDGTEPVATSQLYTSPIWIGKTTNVRAKLFCDGYLSPRSTTHSYISLGRDMIMPVVSMVTVGDYFYSRDKGIYNEYNNGTVNNQSYRQDWRRPVNVEIFMSQGEGSVINQLCETRVKGGASRGAALKSLVVYANKRFGTKRLECEFFPEDAPGRTDWKSIELRNSGNDFDYLYFRDALIQRNMGRNADLDWQPYRPAILMINGEYKGMLNIRSRTNEDYVYTLYDGEEDIDMFENWWELKEGTWDNYNAFKEFYSGTGQTYDEFEKRMDTGEFANLMIMELFHNNLDFPGNNIVMWRPRAEGGRWRWIAKDTDFGLGLYDRTYAYKTFDWLHDNNFDKDNAWANKPEHTRLFRRLMDVREFRDMFVDRCAVYMGDFLNGRVIGAEIDAMSSAIKPEYTRHRALFNPWWPNYDEEVRKAKQWATDRTEFFYTHLADYYKLGTPRAVTIDARRTDDVALRVNGVPLRGRSFDGKYFQGRTLTVEGASDGATVDSWRVTVRYGGSSSTVQTFPGPKLSIVVPSCVSLSVESVISHSGIGEIGCDGDGEAFDYGQTVDVYDIGGRRLMQGVPVGEAVSLLPSGIYVVRHDGKAVKIAVR